jgi:hypothetical protein
VTDALLRRRPAESTSGALGRLGFGSRSARPQFSATGFLPRLTIRSSRPRIVASAMCFTLRSHMSAAPPRGGLTQALALMEASDIAAWWGAGLATIVLGWDIYKWFTSGARLFVKVQPNMQEVGDPRETKNILVEVVNRGDKLTTLTHLAFYSYKNRFYRLIRRRNPHVGIVPRPGGPGLPFELEPGKRWAGLVEQDAVFAEHKDGLVFAVIVHSGSSKELLFPVTRPG